MSINQNEMEKSFDDFSTDLIGKTNLFFKSFKELTKENLENYLDFLGLLDIWNTEDEKQFLWNTFYKYNIKGKIVESSVLKGMNEILSKEEMKSSIISFNEKNDNYSRDDNVNLIRLSFDKIRSASIIKSSLDKDLKNEQNNLKFDKNVENLNKFVDNCNIKKLKAIRNIFILLNYNNSRKNNFLVKISQIKNIINNYFLLTISIEDILKYISFISEKNKHINKDDEEFNINNDAYNLGLKLIENKLKKLENENSINENLEIDDLSSNSINNLKESNISNKLEQKLKIYLENILNINDELKINIIILKDLENSMKNCYQNIINNLKNLLSLNNFGSRNEDIIKITDNCDDNQEELKIIIENNIFFMNKKYDEVDIFLQEIENNFKLKDKRFKNLNIILDKLIETNIFLENEINRLLKNKKETEENVNIEFNKADEQINKLFDEKEILNNKIREFVGEIENLKSKNKIINEKINELGNDNDMKRKEIIEKSEQISKLKLEIKNHKNKYDSLVNELIQINNDKEKLLKNNEKQLISNALNNISKKIELSDKQKNYINYNLEQLLEQLIKLEGKYNNEDKNFVDKEKIIKEKNKKISQLETDLELYREKTLFLSQENRNLKIQLNNNSSANINLNNEQNQSYFNLENLAESTYSIKIEDNNKSDKNNFTIFNNENQILNNNNNEEKILQQKNSGNLFAPPCFTNKGENEEDNINTNEIKNSINPNNNKNNITKFSNENEKMIGRNDDKKFINTPGQELNNVNKEEEIKNNEIINSLNFKDRPSNPYINDIYDRKSSSSKENKGNLFNINKSNNEIFKSIDNLNINEEKNKNHESIENRENQINNDKIKQIINNSLNLNVEKFLSLKDMYDILLKNYKNKLDISSYDYLHLFTNQKIKEIFDKIGEDYIHTDIFSDIIYLLDKYEQLYKNIIFITKKCVYIIEPESYKIKYTFVRTILLRFTLSSINCNIIVFHFMTSNDLVFMTLRRPELISYFINTEKNIKNYRKEIKFRYADEFNIKKDGDYYTQKIKSSMNSTSFNFQTAIKLGYLIKINEGYLFSKYHEKLVVLTEFGLFYFDNPTLAPKKLVSIIGAEIKDLKNKFGEKLFSFEIVTMNHYKIIFGTYCKEDYEEWLEKLRETKNKFENKNMFLG